MLQWAALRRGRRPLRLASTEQTRSDNLPLQTRDVGISAWDSSSTLNGDKDESLLDEKKSPEPQVTETASFRDDEPLKKRHAPWFGDWWMWELFGIFGSAATLIAIVVILAKHNRAQQPEWKHASLNSLVSGLSTLAKVFTLFPATRALSQMKWIWFASEDRKLSDLTIFDAASRGATGSIELLWSLRCGSLVTLGALVTILAVAFEPFVQNVIRYHPQPVPSATEPAFLAIVSFYDYSGQNYSWHTAAHPLLRTNVENAMYYFDKPELWAQPSYSCRTGDCTWGFVSTVTVRSECSDVSDKLVYSQVPMKDPAVFGYTKSVSFPDGPRIQYQEADGSGNPMGSVMYVQAITRDSPPWGIRAIEPRGNVNFAENLSWLEHSKASFIGTECILVPCIRSFRASVSNGTYREEDVKEWCKGGLAGGNFPIWQIQHPAWGPERGVWPGEVYGIGRNGFRGIDDFFHSSFNGYMDVEAPAIRFVPVQDGSVEGGGVQILRGMFTRKFASTECENSMHKINCSFASLATAITKSIRDAPYAEHGWESANMARGQTLVSAQYVEVRWSWLMLPILVWTLSTVAYVGTAWETRRAKLQPWGSNPLPLLFLYEDTDSKRGLHGGTSEAAFVERSKNIKVRLHVSETEARLVDA